MPTQKPLNIQQTTYAVGRGFVEFRWYGLVGPASAIDGCALAIGITFRQIMHRAMVAIPDEELLPDPMLSCNRNGIFLSLRGRADAAGIERLCLEARAAGFREGVL